MTGFAGLPYPHQPTTTGSSGSASWICGACGKKQTSGTIWVDLQRSIVHCGCSHQA